MVEGTKEGLVEGRRNDKTKQEMTQNKDHLKRAGEKVRASAEEQPGEGMVQRPPDLCARPSGSPRGTTRRR